jgi:Rieske Fe-S protein
MSDMTRRDAIGLAVIGTAACACGALGADGGEKEKGDPAARPKQFSVGKITDYPKPGFYDNFRAKPHNVMISVVDDQLVVMSAICTHKMCVLRKQEDKVLRCPCHKSFFSEYGTPTEGQAKVALPRYAVSVLEDGTINVDTTQSFGEREWEKPQAFIPLKKS